jgi:hypothetical protein
MFQLNWQEFSRRPHIAKLPLHEQVRQFHWEQQRYNIMLEYVANSSISSAAAAAGSGGGAKSQQDASANNYIENNYIDNYFE